MDSGTRRDFIELRLTHPDDAFLTVDIVKDQAQDFAAAQTRCVKQDDRETQYGASQWRIRRWREGLCLRQHPGDRRRLDEDRLSIRLWPSKVQRVWHEATWLAPLAIQAELADDELMGAARVSRQ